MALAALVAWASMMVDAHHLSDITASTLIALAIAWFFWRWVEKSGDEAWERLKRKLQDLRKRRKKS